MTARLWLAQGLDPVDPDVVLPIVAVDPEGDPAERAVARLCNQGYEGDRCLYLVRTDGWAERHRSDDGTLTVSVVAYRPAGQGDPEPSDCSKHDPQAVLLLTVRAPVAAHMHARASRATALVVAERERSLGDIEADLATGALWPLILAPPPAA
ncbi:hypothetical protein ACIPYQ_28320 [Streptomyces sp. NPDC090045]|uniref:hypothetical protein n=1 Tax=Streptomyces sp. NPDC090045 TaxID=3365927 RepID=UPI00380646A9